MAVAPNSFAQSPPSTAQSPPSADMSDAQAPPNENSAAPAAAAAPATPPAAPASAVAPPVAAAAPSKAPVWKEAMTLYELGQSDESLELLRKKAIECGDAGQPQCSDEERAALYMCVGIVLSGGKANHAGGVQAFKKALTLDSTMRVAPEYAMKPVTDAFAEAQGRSPEPAPTASTPVPSAADEFEDFEPPVQKGRIFFLASATGKFGWGTLYDYYDYDYDYGYYDYDSTGIAQVGGGLTFAGMPGKTSGFTLGARIRGGGLFGNPENVGYVGGNLFLGATLGRRQEDEFIFLLGGAGIESYPGRGSSAATAHFLGGVSLGGLVLGASADFGVSYNVAYALFGLEVGFAQLY